MRTALMIAAAIVFISPAMAAETTPQGVSLFGLFIGKAIQLPKCPVQRPLFGGSKDLQSVDKSQISGMCFSVPFVPNAQKKDVYFGKGLGPSWRNTDHFSVEDDNEGVQRITVLTGGLKSQDQVLAELKEKFGQPTEEKLTKSSNAYGGTFEVIEASWAIGTTLVLFDGAFEINAGSITAISAKAIEANRARQRGKGTAL